MRKILFLFLMFLVSYAAAESLNVDFSGIKSGNLSLLKTLSYGDGDENIGVYIPGKGVEDLPFGANAITATDDKLFIADNVNRRVLSYNPLTKSSNIEFFLPEKTFNDMFFKDDKLILHNGNENRYYEMEKREFFSSLNMNGVVPEKVYIKTADIKTPKAAKYPNTLFHKPGIIRVILEKDRYIDLNFGQNAPVSFSFKGTDKLGDFHFKVDMFEKRVVRYHMVFNPESGFVSKIKIPEAELFVPEKDLFVNSDGTFYLIVPDKKGMKIYKGGVR